jgi:hypothetical protein
MAMPDTVIHFTRKAVKLDVTPTESQNARVLAFPNMRAQRQFFIVPASDGANDVAVSAIC